MFKKIRAMFNKPSGYDQMLFNDMQQMISTMELLNNHILALARITLVTPDRLFKEAINTKANTEYLESLIKAKNAK